MNLTLLYFLDCPHWQTADELLTKVANENPDVALSRRIVDTDADATALGFRGSPTIHIDGVDPFADPSAPVGLSCRLYPTPDGYTGPPTLDQLRNAVQQARRT